MHPRSPGALPVIIEVPRWSFIKYEIQPRPDGGHERRVDYVSPLPCPFHYGSLDAPPGPDGDPPDAVLLDPAPARPGDRRAGHPIGVVRFMDAGVPDDKLILALAPRPPTRHEILLVTAFFRLYAPLRAAMNRLRGLPGTTRLLSVTWTDTRPDPPG